MSNDIGRDKERRDLALAQLRRDIDEGLASGAGCEVTVQELLAEFKAKAADQAKPNKPSR